MDNEQKNLPEENGNWLDDILGTSETAKELGPDELAVQAAGLTHPDDLELEKILSEDWDSVPDLEQITQEQAAEVADSEPVFEEQTFIEELLKEPIPQPEPETELPEQAQTAEPPVSEDATVFFTPVENPQPEQPEEIKPEEPAAEEKVRVRKIRPTPKKGYGLFGIPHILATGIWLVIILLIGLTLGHTLWSGITDLMAFGRPDQQITITVTDADVQILADGTKVVDIDGIANKLKDAGLIKNPEWFKIFADTLTDKAYDIEPGTYTLNTKYDYNALINNMQSYASARKEVEILIPEGYTCAQIFALLEENGVCSVADMEAYMIEVGRDGQDGEYPLSGYWFLEGAPRADKYWMEGYMFPDTYRFYLDDEPENVAKKFLDGFDFRFTDVMKEKLESFQEKTGLDYGIREIIIIASMIEKETAGTDDSYMISSVIYNRLTDNSKYWYLNIDATIYYALGGNIDPETGLPKPLTQADLEMDHPYNTYVNRGLPPGAISNPGRNSIDAALTPDQHSYPFYVCYNGRIRQIESADSDSYELYYYVYNPHDGVHIFSETESDQDYAIEYINSLD